MRRTRALPLVFVALLGALFGCGEFATEPAPTGFLAILAKVTASPGVHVGEEYRYRITEQSGTFAIDTVVTAGPLDTVFLRVPGPAGYTVEIEDGLPLNCQERNGGRVRTAVPPPATAIVRYSITCRAPLTVQTFTLGAQKDEELIYRIVREDQVVRSGRLASSDTVVVDQLNPGSYVVRLDHVSDNCVITSDGERRQAVTVEPAVQKDLLFKLHCADEAARPALLDFAATFPRDSVMAIYFRARDPDADLDRYFWDVTDCNGSSVLPDGGRELATLTDRGLRTYRQEVVEVLAGFAPPLTVQESVGLCAKLWVADTRKNTTPIREIPLASSRGRAPVATLSNAVLRSGRTRLRIELAVEDPDGDFVGVFPVLILRDGVAGSFDGRPDRAYFNIVGYLGSDLPELSLGPLTWTDILAAQIHLIDRQGNVTRIEDRDLLN